MLVSEIICNFAFEKIKLFKQLETKLYTMKQEDKSSLKNTLYAQMHKQYLENDSSKTSTIHYYIGAIAFIFSASWGFTLFRYGLISKRKKPKYSSNLGFNPLEFRLQTLCSLFVIIMTLR